MLSLGAVIEVALLSTHDGAAAADVVGAVVSLLQRLLFFSKFFFPLVLTHEAFGSGLGLEATPLVSKETRMADETSLTPAERSLMVLCEE